MRIYHWIDKYNQKICYEIIKRYSSGITSGKSAVYSLHLSFWPYYLLRLLLVLLSIILLKKNAYRDFYKIVFYKWSAFYPPGQHWLFYRKIADLFATLFGFRYLSPIELFPFLPDKKILGLRIEMDSPKAPLVSIVITINHKLCYIYNTLLSIQKNSSSAQSFEIIVIDETLEENTHSFFNLNTDGIIYLTNSINPGLSSWSLGARHAKGELICFLTDSIYACKGWLESLIKTLEVPETGSAGSKIINRNGLLNHAGGIAYSDGSIKDYGKNFNPEHPYYNYRREVDYCSETATIFRKEAFIKIENQRQPSSASAKHIDVYLDLKHTLGKRVLYQPLSQVILTNKDIFTRKKEAKINNQKWQGDLYFPSENINTDARKYQEQKTILFIDDVIPAPDKDSGSNRLFKIMKIVKLLGYHIIFVPNDGKKRGYYFDQMIQEGFEVLYRFPNRKGMIKILSNTLKYVDAAWLCKPHNNNLFSFIFNIKKDCLWIYDTIDLHYLRLQREAELTQNGTLRQSAEAIKHTELSIAAKADMTIAITQDEQVMLQHEKLSNIVVVPNIHEKQHSLSTARGFDDRSGLLFIGGYLHKPNIDAAEWLVKQIMPKIWKVDPSIKLTLLGSNPTEEILAYQCENIIVTGYIQDVSPYFNQSRVFVAPLRFGAGMKGKIGQSLEYGLPIVSTDIGIEGMGLIDGRHVMVANNTEDFTIRTLNLYHSPELWNTIQKNAGEALEQYAPEKVAQRLKAIFESLNLQR